MKNQITKPNCPTLEKIIEEILTFENLEDVKPYLK